tara:strand:- start:1136 stop:2260 length:1125 start_codon:yes stop_codon:yes gene_type:complete
MNRLIIICVLGIFLISGCLGIFGKKRIIDPDDPNFMNNIQKLKSTFRSGNVQALFELITIYEDDSQPVKARIIAGKALAESQHPTALKTISEMVETTGAVDYTFMNESIEMLGMFEENPKAAIAMVKAMHKLEDRTNKIHITLVKNLNKVRAKDQVLALLDLYEVAKSNMSRTERLLAETLGALDDNRVIPILATIAKDPNVDIGIRNMAVEILGKKNPDDAAIAFAELLGDPNTNMEVREFAINTMKGVQEENLILALLNTYNTGKSQYYSLLNTMLGALGEFNEPEVKKAVLEIASSNDYPVDIRKKAIDNLGTYRDLTVIDEILPILQEKNNYIYYDNIIDMIYTLGQEQVYAETVRRMAFSAHYGDRIIE